MLLSGCNLSVVSLSAFLGRIKISQWPDNMSWKYNTADGMTELFTAHLKFYNLSVFASSCVALSTPLLDPCAQI